MQNLLIILIVCVAVGNQQRFVDTAPVSQGISEDNVQEKDFDVQQLENLKKSVGKLGRTMDLLESQPSIYTAVNGENESHSNINEAIKENEEFVVRLTQHVDTAFPTPLDKLVTNIETDVEVPPKENYKSLVQIPPDYKLFTRNNSRRPSAPAVDPLSKSVKSIENVDDFSGTQYSPLDMAEYVFWTGDEKGVTLAIEEFLQEGLMTREEAISFLQEIKYNLEYLKNHYAQLGMNSLQSKIQGMKNKSKNIQIKTYEKIANNLDINQLKREDKKQVVTPTQHLTTLKNDEESGKSEDGDYDEILDRLRTADFLYTEYSLEEVIYQLAKVMFTQSLTHGSAEAQQALQKFTDFLELEAEQGHITKALEKKVLDVLIASLADTLTDQPELLTAASESLSPTATNMEGQNFIKQFLELNPDNKMLTKNLFTYKHQKKNNLNRDQSSDKYDKYKNP